MSTPEQPTCGKGLAENSVLPAKLGELISAIAENLEAHMQALDRTDQNSRREYDAYENWWRNTDKSVFSCSRWRIRWLGIGIFPWAGMMKWP